MGNGKVVSTIEAVSCTPTNVTDIVSRKCCKKYLIGLYVDVSLRSEDFVAENECDTARPDRVQF